MAETVFALIPTSTVQGNKPGLITNTGSTSSAIIYGTDLKVGDKVTINGTRESGNQVVWTGTLDAPTPITNVFKATVSNLVASKVKSAEGDTDDVSVTVGTSEPPALIPISQGEGSS